MDFAYGHYIFMIRWEDYIGAFNVKQTHLKEGEYQDSLIILKLWTIYSKVPR